MKNVVAALVELAAELGLPLNLGGGIARGDRLEEFKRGFANREQPWQHLGDRLRRDCLRAPLRRPRRGPTSSRPTGRQADRGSA